MKISIVKNNWILFHELLRSTALHSGAVHKKKTFNINFIIIPIYFYILYILCMCGLKRNRKDITLLLPPYFLLLFFLHPINSFFYYFLKIQMSRDVEELLGTFASWYFIHIISNSKHPYNLHPKITSHKDLN